MIISPKNNIPKNINRPTIVAKTFLKNLILKTIYLISIQIIKKVTDYTRKFALLTDTKVTIIQFSFIYFAPCLRKIK